MEKLKVIPMGNFISREFPQIQELGTNICKVRDKIDNRSFAKVLQTF